MRLVACFGGAAAVADDCDETAACRGIQKQRRSLASSFRRKFLSSGGKRSKKTKKPSLAYDDEKTSDSDADSLYGGASTSTASSAPLSPSSASSRCPSSVSSSSVRRALAPRSPKRRAAAFPVAGIAAFALCLLMVVLCGKVGATLLTSAALYLLPRRCSPAPPASDSEQQTARKTKVVRKGFFGRNRKQ